MSTKVEATSATLPGATATTSATKHPEEEKHQPDVLVEADKALAEFKRLVEVEYYPKASALQEQAKILFEQVKTHWTDGKHKVLHEHGKWSAEDFDVDMMKLLKEQEASWDKLEKLVAAERVKLDATYQTVLNAKAAIDRVLKSVNHIPVVDLFVDLSTPEQHTICEYYKKHLRHAFQDASKECYELGGYPDGLLTQVKVLRKHANAETARLVEWLAKKDRHHHHHDKHDDRHEQQLPPVAPHEEEQPAPHEEQQEHAVAAVAEDMPKAVTE
jgi:hypothetical protein